MVDAVFFFDELNEWNIVVADNFFFDQLKRPEKMKLLTSSIGHGQGSSGPHFCKVGHGQGSSGPHSVKMYCQISSSVLS